jgi:Ser/Thr protein kinase RdoA (MazF antagonist)
MGVESNGVRILENLKFDHVLRGAVVAALPSVEGKSHERPGPVWQANNHSDWEIRWHETEQAESVGEMLKVHFGFIEVYEVLKVDRVENHSHNFKVSGRTENGDITVFVKKSIREDRPKALQTIGRVYDYLRNSGVPTQRNVSTAGGERVVSHNGHLWQVYEYISGHHFKGTEEELQQAGGAVADMHTAFAEAPQSLIDEITEVRPSRIRKWSADELLQLIGDAELAVANGGGTQRQQVLAKYADYFRVQIYSAVENASRMVGARKQLGKGTVHPQDFIFENGQLKAFIDVEEMEQTELVRDVATALHRQVRQYMVFNKLSSAADVTHGVRVFLDAYTAKNPLTKDEIMLIPVFLRDSLLTKVMSASTSATYAEHEDEGAYELNKFADLLEEVQYIEAAVLEYAQTIPE